MKNENMPKGYKHSEEAKNKIRLTKLGKKRPPFSKIWKENMKNGMKGRCGLHPNSRNGYKNGHRYFNRTSEGIEKMRKALKGNQRAKGKHHKLSEATKRKMREYRINNPNKVFKDTSIELKIEEELKRRNISYQKQVPLCKIAIVDFYLPEYRIVIQCDGDYWHNKSGRKERDEKQDKVLTFNGFNVYRFWEHEINESVENCIKIIKVGQ